MSGLLVGVGDGKGLLVGEGVSVGGSSGCVSIGGFAVSSLVTSGVLVNGSTLVGFLVAGISVEVSVGTSATAVAISVGDPVGSGELEFAKLFAARKTITIVAENRIISATIRNDGCLFKLLTIGDQYP